MWTLILLLVITIISAILAAAAPAGGSPSSACRAGNYAPRSHSMNILRPVLSMSDEAQPPTANCDYSPDSGALRNLIQMRYSGRRARRALRHTGQCRSADFFRSQPAPCATSTPCATQTAPAVRRQVYWLSTHTCSPFSTHK